jgi:hypothetical protein
VFGEAEGDDGDGEEAGAEGGEVADGSLELVAVVPAGTEDDLGVDVDAALGEAAERVHDRGRALDAEHAQAKFRIGGVDGDVHRGELLFNDALEVFVLHVRRGDVVAVEEGHAEIAVLEVDAFAEALGVLVDEAKDAVVVAQPDLEVFEDEAEFLAEGATKAQVTGWPAGSGLDADTESTVGALIEEVDGVADGLLPLMARMRSPGSRPARAPSPPG